MQWGVYVHIPFCRSKCQYCDFASYAGREEMREAYVDALGTEMLVRGQEMVLKHGRPETVYVGGGTPTALNVEQLSSVVALIKSVFGTAAEFTMEVNPGTVDGDLLKKLHEWGVNRLSIGIQSFDNNLLKRLGRIHTAEQAEEAVKLARAAGFDNLSLDLMYGLPGQTMEDLQKSVKKALSLQPEHISIYGLQVEEGTPFYRDQQAGRLNLPESDVTDDMYDYLTEYLPEQGYRRYEISNYAKPGKESRLNVSYWQDVRYLGLGAAAHSYMDGMRLENVDYQVRQTAPALRRRPQRAAPHGRICLPGPAHRQRHRQEKVQRHLRQGTALCLRQKNKPPGTAGVVERNKEEYRPHQGGSQDRQPGLCRISVVILFSEQK